jgi:hypothetical protein
MVWTFQCPYQNWVFGMGVLLFIFIPGTATGILGTFFFLFFPSDFNTSLVLVLGSKADFCPGLKAGMKSGILYSYCTYIYLVLLSQVPTRLILV